jgi:uncharacterized protein with ParB-like and HNH nuclease domain
MAGDYEKAISIKEAMDRIVARDLLLPAIQRNFVWSPHQICALFDSLMRGYPINTFMMWDITSQSIKENYRFYDFLKEFCQRFAETNSHFETRGHKHFKAVIDGQQRLTSIYIGLNGTYAYKQPRVWWPTVRNDNVLPPRRLYIDLMQPVQDEESLMLYNFRFLTAAQYKQSEVKSDCHWYEVGRILTEPEVSGLDKIPFQVALPYLRKHGLDANEFAMETLTSLYVKFRMERLIHYYNETSQDIDHVLDIFIRTNSGGTPLAFSDLLMSIAVANWQGDARKDIDELAKGIWQDPDMGFSIDQDWILKACLMLTGADVRFRVKNFGSSQVEVIESQWPAICQCITETFKLIRLLGLKDQSLRAKNAVIPITYYLYRKTFKGQPLFKTINNLAYNREERLEIGRWLHMSLLKGVFGGQADGMLTKLRKILDANIGADLFPLTQIINAYKGTNKDLRFDQEYISNLLQIQHGDSRCRSVLSLIFPEVNENQILHIDHLHPKSAFTGENLKKLEFLQSSPDLMGFYRNPAHWNAIPNLHLLNSSQNCSKNDMDLQSWLSDSSNGFRREDLLLDPSVSLEFSQFQAFYSARYEAMRKRLCSRLFVSEESLADNVVPDDEEDDTE